MLSDLETPTSEACSLSRLALFEAWRADFSPLPFAFAGLEKVAVCLF